MDKVGKLAHPAADPLGGDAAFDGQPFPVAFFGGQAPHQMPEGEGLPRADKDAVHLGCRQGEIYRLVLLKL